MSTLNDLYKAEGDAVLNKLHEALGVNRKYLWQIATSRRRPSSALAKRMVEAEPRLSLEELLFPNEALPSRAATTTDDLLTPHGQAVIESMEKKGEKGGGEHE